MSKEINLGQDLTARPPPTTPTPGGDSMDASILSPITGFVGRVDHVTIPIAVVEDSGNTWA